MNWKYLSTAAGAFVLIVCGALTQFPAADALAITNAVPVNDRIWVSIAFWLAGYVLHHYSMHRKVADQIADATGEQPIPSPSLPTMSASVRITPDPFAGQKPKV